MQHNCIPFITIKKRIKMRKITVAANWKMNKTIDEGLDFARDMMNRTSEMNCRAILNVPYIHLYTMSNLLSGSPVDLGAQNCHDQESGAYTGEISADMLVSTGAKYVVLGHSERRAYFNETDELILEKVKIALSRGLTPIFCCGEPLEVRDADKHIDFVEDQMNNSIFRLSVTDFSRIIIAYEPIWAIGTGRTASPEQAQEMHAALRKLIEDKFDAETAASMSILYGGSCKPSNAESLFSLPDVDGGLIGGASLKVDDFLSLCDIASGIKKS